MKLKDIVNQDQFAIMFAELTKPATPEIDWDYEDRIKVGYIVYEYREKIKEMLKDE